MRYSEWMVRPIMRETPEGECRQYQLYRMEIGGNFYDRDTAEDLAYELNKEAHGELDK